MSWIRNVAPELLKVQRRVYWVQLTPSTNIASRTPSSKLDSILRAYFHVCETMYFQAGVGTGDRGIVLAEERGMQIIVTSPRGREWWMENPFGFSTEFREYVEILSKSAPQSDSTT